MRLGRLRLSRGGRVSDRGVAATAAACGWGARLGQGECLCPATPLAKVMGRRYALGLLSLVANSDVIRFSERGRELCGVLTAFLRRGTRPDA